MFPKSTRVKNLEQTVSKFRITNVAEFFGQVAQESARLTKFEESMNYSVEALLSTFSRRRISEEECRRYGRTKTQQANQRAIAECLYGYDRPKGKELGNTKPGDGWLFRGHGAIQLTGRAAHLAFSQYMGRPEIMLTPALVATDAQLSCDAAGWFWTVYKQINGLTDLKRITQLVTGSENHFLAERTALTAEAAKLLRT